MYPPPPPPFENNNHKFRDFVFQFLSFGRSMFNDVNDDDAQIPEANILLYIDRTRFEKYSMDPGSLVSQPSILLFR
ncbi:hypothetical protein DERP_012661 [Dermatophagoides pteronyssinus]|uniref:Uncharacterized protein n=1 Tax=Dermatophagoides pteronyssinus TaxID=6956 RepID=A0ABQ8IZ50_DERPT|nr:hypothetical protein DERP_012661 [Dermatophagoides pteronyssinus]